MNCFLKKTNSIKIKTFRTYLLQITLRKVQKNDWDFILELRNKFYHFFYKQKKPIPKKEHYEYMEKQRQKSNFHQWIIMYDKKEAGYVRILDNDVGIMVDDKFQNKGIASKALNLAENEAAKLGIKKLIALIAVDNDSSKKIFEKNNYLLKQFWYEKDIV